MHDAVKGNPITDPFTSIHETAVERIQLQLHELTVESSSTGDDFLFKHVISHEKSCRDISMKKL